MMEVRQISHFGIYIEKENNYLHLCTCGHSWETEDKLLKCPNCNTDIFKEISDKYVGGYVASNPHLVVVERGDWGFIVQKINIKAKYNKKENILKHISEYKNILYYDFRNKNFVFENSKDEKHKIYEENIRYFFRGIDDDEFLDLVSTDKSKILFQFAKKVYGQGARWSTPDKLSKGLANLYNRPYYQILANAGFSQNSLISINKNDYRHYYEEENWLNKNETKPHLILKIPKYTLNYIKDLKLNCSIINNLKQLDLEFGADNLKYILDTFMNECNKNELESFLKDSHVTDFINIVKNYNYKVNSLIEYLCRTIKLQQGIMNPNEALGILKDYLRMSKIMEIECDKYSKSLKKDHDIAMMNYKVNEDEYIKKQFQKAIQEENYNKMIFKNNDYIITIPNEPKDLVKEGQSLSHCVASYVNDVINKRCKILFMRNKNHEKESLLTIEVRNNNIIQVKGFGQRNPSQDEEQFIKKWSEKKKLQYAI